MTGSPTRLRRGDLLPRIVTPPPGEAARAAAATLALREAPGINTLTGSAHPILWAEARGANVLDVDGNRYLDFSGGFGVAAVGHRHPAVVRAVRAQAGRLLHGLGDLHAHPGRLELATALATRAPFPDARVYFAVSGSDAVEIALKSALLATGRRGIVAFDGAYHGVTLGALGTTGIARFRHPFAAHLHPFVERRPWGEPLRLEYLADEEVGAVIVEPIQGRGGVRMPPPGWLDAVGRFARERGALLVADEILTGGGRTGTFWALEGEGPVPDLLCAGKAIGGGLPVGAVLGRREVLEAWPADAEALHTGTFVAHPLSCAAALATLPLLDELLADPAPRAASALLESRLRELAARRPDRVREVRGRGHLWGVALRRPGAAIGLAASALVRGLLVLPSGSDADVLELLPSLAVTGGQVEAAGAILDASFDDPAPADAG